MAEMSRATVVLAVPGSPVKIMCRDGGGGGQVGTAAQLPGPGFGGQGVGGQPRHDWRPNPATLAGTGRSQVWIGPFSGPGLRYVR
jgi:hypothetical protein